VSLKDDLLLVIDKSDDPAIVSAAFEHLKAITGNQPGTSPSGPYEAGFIDAPSDDPVAKNARDYAIPKTRAEQLGQVPYEPASLLTELRKSGDSFAQGALDAVSAGQYSRRFGDPRLREEYPIADTVGQTGGGAASMLVGPAAVIGRTATAAVHALPLAEQVGGRALGRIAQNTASGILAGAGQGLLESEIAGDDKGAGALEGATGGALLGGGLSAGGELATGVSNVVRRLSPLIDRYVVAKGANRYQSPDLAGFEPNERGVRQLADQGIDRIASDRAARAQDEVRLHGEASAPVIGEIANTFPVLNSLESLRQGNVGTHGKVVNQSLPGIIDSQVDYLKGNPTTGDLVKMRKSLRQGSGFGSTAPTDQQNITREVYDAFRNGIRDSSPEIARADDRLTAFNRQQERFRDIMYGTDKEVDRNLMRAGSNTSPDVDAALEALGADVAGQVNPDIRVGKQLTASDRMIRSGGNDVPSDRFARYLNEASDISPAYAQSAQNVADLRARTAVRFSGEALHPESMRPLVGGLPLIKQNLRAIGGQIVEPAARNLGYAADTAQYVPGAIPGSMGEFMAMLAEYKQRQEQRRKRKPR
jgi:hypothetical protein